jgi:lipopolysaccharide biosynthesis glycosyltransferase
MLARELADRYRRILYLDCDIMMEGGDLNRLFAIDLGEHPLGAVLDAPFFANLHYLAAEYRALNLSQHPYLNGGVLLIDTARYIAEAVEERAFAHCVRNPAALRHADQSALNLALMGKFAQLAPCWNWQGSRRLPFATFRYPVFLRHFIGPVKPDRYSGPNLAARHNQAYRDFLTQMMPDHLPGVAPAPDPSPLTLGEIARFTLEHLRARPALSALFARHADPYRAIL